MEMGQSRDDITYYEIPVRDIIKQFDIPTDAATGGQHGLCGRGRPPCSISRWTRYCGSADGQLQGQGKTRPDELQIVESAYRTGRREPGQNVTRSLRAAGHDRGQNHDHRQRGGSPGRALRRLTVTAWYPITPSTSLVDAVMDFRTSA
jgi:hypothetical protein